ncbi:MAG: hypothetical protein Q4G64_01500 [bacterium]|nr:hypothetical protein [bacterium]
MTRHAPDDEFAARWDELTRQLGELDTPAAARGAGSGPRDYVADDDYDTAFVPPEPGPGLTGISARARLGWFLLLTGIVGIVIAFVASAPPFIAALCALLAAGGLVALILSLPARRDPDDGPGAVV